MSRSAADQAAGPRGSGGTRDAAGGAGACAPCPSRSARTAPQCRCRALGPPRGLVLAYALSVGIRALTWLCVRLSIKVSSKRPPALGDPAATGDPARHVGTGTRTPSSSSDGEPCGARGGCSLCSRLRMRAGTGRELPHSRWHDDDVAPGVALGTRPASSPSATWRCSHSPSARSYLPVQSHRPAPSTRHLRREVTHSLGSWAVVLTG